MKRMIRKILAHFGYEIRRIPSYAEARRMPGYTKEGWKDEIAGEVSFWDNYLKTGGDRWKEDFKTRRDPEAVLQDIFLNYLDKTQTKNKILDVGAGPLTIVNKKCSFTGIEICPVDPLADEYDKILEKYAVKPIVRTQKCDGENLTEKFKENTFDIVYSRNAIDHSYDPLKCFEEMIKVTRKGQFIILQLSEREGEKENWRGLHKWNFSAEKSLWIIGQSNVFLQGRTSKKINLTYRFKDSIKLVHLMKKEGWFDAIFKKIR